MRKPKYASPEWARARILLNLLDVPAATEAALAAWKAHRLPKGTRFGLAEVIGQREIPPGWCFFIPAERVAVLNMDTYETHACYYEMYAFCDTIADLTKPTWVHFDVRSWELMNDLYAAEAAERD